MFAGQAVTTLFDSLDLPSNSRKMVQTIARQPLILTSTPAVRLSERRFCDSSKQENGFPSVYFSDLDCFILPLAPRAFPHPRRDTRPQAICSTSSKTFSASPRKTPIA